MTDAHQLGFTKTYDGKTICIAINFDKEEAVTFSGLEYANCEYVSATGGKAEYKNGTLTLPGYTIAILSGE